MNSRLGHWILLYCSLPCLNSFSDPKSSKRNILNYYVTDQIKFILKVLIQE